MSLKKVLLLWLGIVILIALVASTLFISRSESARLADTLETQKAGLSQEILSVLSVTNALLQNQTKASMQLFLREIERQGGISQGEPVQVADKTVPDLVLAEQTLANQFELVDDLTRLMGGTATLFSRSGDDFVRISTNVQTATGRAIGTVLDPTGKAIAAIKNGQAFYGAVDILGNPFITGYEPLVDSNNNVIGIAYVGYKADIAGLTELVAKTRILSNGFVALLDRRGNVRAVSAHQNEEQVKPILANQDTAWSLDKVSFEPWGYDIYLAVAKADVSGIVQAILVKIIVAAVIFAAALLGVLYWLIHKLVLHPVDKVNTTLSDLVKGEGDLTSRLNMARNDEIGQMATGFDQLLERLRVTIQHVAQTAGALNGQAVQLEQAAVQTTERILQQNQHINTITSAIGQISATSDDVAQSAKTADQQTANITALNSQLNQVISKTAENAQNQIMVMQESASALNNLKQASQEIMKVLDVINAIADQTNLLALNAAIEAARAGEQGRGFSVVADEVRLLASRTQASTGEIKNMISSLEAGVKQVEQLNQNYRNTVDDSVSITTQAQAALTEVNAGIVAIREKNADIVDIANQQSKMTLALSHSANQVSSDTAGTADIAKNSQALAVNVGEHTQSMLLQLKKYRV